MKKRSSKKTKVVKRVTMTSFLFYLKFWFGFLEKSIDWNKPQTKTYVLSVWHHLREESWDPTLGQLINQHKSECYLFGPSKCIGQRSQNRSCSILKELPFISISLVKLNLDEVMRFITTLLWSTVEMTRYMFVTLFNMGMIIPTCIFYLITSLNTRNVVSQTVWETRKKKKCSPLISVNNKPPTLNINLYHTYLKSFKWNLYTSNCNYTHIYTQTHIRPPLFFTVFIRF